MFQNKTYSKMYSSTLNKDNINFIESLDKGGLDFVD